MLILDNRDNKWDFEKKKKRNNDELSEVSITDICTSFPLSTAPSLALWELVK